MGAGQCDLYKGTYGDKIENIPSVLKGKIKFPDNDAQVKHILREGPGHLPYSEDNKKELIKLANNPRYYIGKDERGIEWSSKILEDGAEMWVSSRNGIIQNGGINNPPHRWDERTGLSDNIFKKERKRK